MSSPVNLAEHAFRRAVGRRCSLSIDGETIVGRVLPGLSKLSAYATWFRLRARETNYIRLDHALRLKLLPAAPVRRMRRKRA